MTNRRLDIAASFNPTLLSMILITIVTWAPLLFVLIPALQYGGINEDSLGTGTRYYLSPHVLFVTMTLCTITFFFLSFLPMCLSFFRGYFVKFCEKRIYFKGKKFEINEIEKIEPMQVFGKHYNFILKSGQSFVVPTPLNREISEYIETRFHKMIK